MQSVFNSNKYDWNAWNECSLLNKSYSHADKYTAHAPSQCLVYNFLYECGASHTGFERAAEWKEIQPRIYVHIIKKKRAKNLIPFILYMLYIETGWTEKKRYLIL